MNSPKKIEACPDRSLRALARGVSLRKLVLAVVTVASLLPSAAWAQEKFVRAEPEALRVEDMTEAELQQRLGEWEAGKRDDRDGYIVLNQIWFNLQAQRKTDSPEFQTVAKKRDALLKKKPDFNNLKDFRLSDQIRHDAKGKERQERLKAEALAWTPTDSVPTRLIIQGNKVAAVFQFKIGFYEANGPVTLLPKTQPGEKRRIAVGGQETSLDSLQQRKVVTFRHRLSLASGQPKDVSALLVCTSATGSQYTGLTPDEDSKIIQRGFRYGSMPWENKSAARQDFCGVFSLSGDELVEFPGKFVAGKTAWEPIGISKDGRRAAVAIGTLKKVRAGGDSYMQPSAPWDVWIWNQGSAPTKKVVKDATEHDLRRRFFLGTL